MTLLLNEGIGEVGDVLLSSAPLYANGDVYYVATGGNDSWDGLSEDTAFATLAQAASTAGNGDTIVILSGYTETRTSTLEFTQNDLTILGCGLSNGQPTVQIDHNAASGAAVSLAGDRILLANVTFLAANQANGSGRLQVAGNNCVLRGVRVECGQYEAVGLYLAPQAEATTDIPGARLEDCTIVSVATLATARGARGLYVLTSGNVGRVDLTGLVLDNGAVGFSTAACEFGTGSAQHVRCENLSLLRGAEFVLQSGNTGYVYPSTVTGGGRVKWG